MDHSIKMFTLFIQVQIYELEEHKIETWRGEAPVNECCVISTEK